MSSSSPRPPAPEGSGSELSSHDARRGLSRRAVIGGETAAVAGAFLASGWAGRAAAATRTLAGKGPGSVSQALDLPPGFTSRYVVANGLRQHVVIGGDGPPLLLVHGWPQFWYQFRRIMPGLARDVQVIAPDQRCRGLTSKPRPAKPDPDTTPAPSPTTWPR